MRSPRPALAALLLAASLLAGCATSSDPTTSTSTTHATTTAAHAAGGGTGTAVSVPAGAAPVEVTPRAATLTASSVNGTAPLNVTFTAGATGGPADNRTAWTLSFGDGNQTTGHALPANVTHLYRAAGNRTARLDVRFADNATANATLVLHLKGGHAPLPDITFHAKDTIVVGTQGAVAPAPSGCGITGTVDSFSYDWAIIPAVPATITSIHVHLALGTTNVDSDVHLYDATGKEVGSGTDFNEPVIGSGNPYEDFTVKGPLATGKYTLVVDGCVAANGDFTLDGTATLVTA